MKNYSLLFFVLISGFVHSQVGIGTVETTPGYELDVNGSLRIQDEFKVSSYENLALTNNEYKLLVRLLNSDPVGEVAYLDISSVDIAPVNVADYVFTNLQRDNVTAVNLQFDADKYIVGLTNFRYVGAPIVKGTGENIGHFVTRTYVNTNTNTWHIEMRNRSRDNANNNAITYYVTLVIYDKKYFKTLPRITHNFGGGTTATIPAPNGL